jgi:hypothetical protein
MKNKSIVYIILGAALILLAPLIAMQFTDKVVWDRADFIIAWILLMLVGISYKILIKSINKRKIIYSILVIMLGTFIFVFGGYDDSPGGQLIGLVLAIIGIVGIIKYKKKTSK